MKILAIALTLGLVFTLGASGVLVTAANAAGPGSLLYPIDRSLENLRMEMTTSSQAAAHLEAQFAVERLREVEDLLDRGDLDYLDQAISEAGLVLAELETPASSDVSFSAEFVDTLVNAALEVQVLQQENENENLNENVNENENLNENLNENENENTNANENVNGNENTNENVNGNENANANENVNANENLKVNANEHVTFKQPKSGIHCGGGGGGTNHPAGEKLAAGFGVDYGEVMEWFCRGYGFGEVKLGYMLRDFSGKTIDEIMALRGSGMGWGNVMKHYGLIGKGAKNPKKPVVPTNPLLIPPSNTTTNPVYGNGNGNGKGNNGKGNNGKGNNGKGKGKP